MRKSFLVASLVGIGCLAQPAVADENVKGVTIEELEAALSVGFQVQRDTTAKGDTFLIVKGKSHIIAAVTITCGGDTTCDGVRYFSILKDAPSQEAINKFNLDPNYSKVALGAGGKAVIAIDHYVGGGVAAENLLRTGAVLMAGMSRLGEAQNIAAVNKPTTTALLSFDTARANEALARDLAGMRAFALDPALDQAFTAQVENSPR